MAVEEVKWYCPMDEPFRISGFAWISRDKVYRRLPLDPGFEIPEAVDMLADHSAGGQVSFKTDSLKIILKVELASRPVMEHMAATGQNGFDCYIRSGTKQIHCSTAKFSVDEKQYVCKLFDTNESEMREFTLNFPLYQKVDSVWIGLDTDACVEKPCEFATDKPVIFYGTSITQGGCSSRPGMAYTNILSRKINVECINLGFSGNGKGEPGIAKLISSINDPACIVLDYEVNAASFGTYEETLPRFIEILRDEHPTVPILLITGLRLPGEILDVKVKEDRNRLENFQRCLLADLSKKGDSHLHCINGADLTEDEETDFTVDGIHPTDLGFWLIAKAIEPVLSKILDL